MNYIKEEMKLLNMKKLEVYGVSSRSRSEPEIFEIENDMSIEEKILFIDSRLEGVATYMIELLAKWEDEKDSLPKDNYDRPKTVSRKAWLRKNDTRKLITIDYRLGSYYMFGTYFKSMELECPSTEYGYNLIYTGKHVVEQWFHDMLFKLYIEEKKYFEENDKFSIKLKEVKDLGSNYGILFNSMELNDIVWNSKKDVSEENLDLYINAYEKLKRSINEIEVELHGLSNIEMIES